ncbi:hypothetical protein LOTGIDRAFT_168040 [Lottia gigantea]|uniref:Somatostatin/Cortistatin C-terminal domain-containing protein n=1 Tax=Lottia gigantea TaxID=225164 RepID=V3ZLQ1_LOTGI|nr:hypothetical protein LOTGIDRAFT_168040 [Lottia gigantea]ESO85232.1 hypothetical protein LOTGIDRAFT_168040 [Lottia gigantea]
MVGTRYLQLATSLAVFLLVLFLTCTQAAPVDDFETDNEALRKALFIARLLSSSDRLKNTKPEGSNLDFSELASIPFSNQQKRYRPPMQGRSGGMSLCLWKVCPAAPWLVSKRSEKTWDKNNMLGK